MSWCWAPPLLKQCSAKTPFKPSVVMPTPVISLHRFNHVSHLSFGMETLGLMLPFSSTWGKTQSSSCGLLPISCSQVGTHFVHHFSWLLLAHNLWSTPCAPKLQWDHAHFHAREEWLHDDKLGAHLFHFWWFDLVLSLTTHLRATKDKAQPLQLLARKARWC